MTTNLLDKLRGGDLRSTGRADEVVAALERNPARFAEVFAGLRDDDPVVRARASDVIEKVTRKAPNLLSAYRKQLVAMLQAGGQQEVCWHLAQMIPRLALSAREQDAVVAALRRYLKADSRIVRVCALDALARIAAASARFRGDVRRIVAGQLRTGSPAVKARARKWRRLLD